MNTLISASSLNGNDVKNSKGEDLGNIKDMMINPQTGEIEYYVLSFGGFMGMGDKLFAIPPETLRIDRENECCSLNIDDDRLENAPGFDKDNWPNMADDAFRNQIHSYYNTDEYRKAA